MIDYNALIKSGKSVQEISKYCENCLIGRGTLDRHSGGILVYEPLAGEDIFEIINLSSMWFYLSEDTTKHTLILPSLNGISVTFTKRCPHERQ